MRTCTSEYSAWYKITASTMCTLSCIHLRLRRDVEARTHSLSSSVFLFPKTFTFIRSRRFKQERISEEKKITRKVINIHLRTPNVHTCTHTQSTASKQTSTSYRNVFLFGFSSHTFSRCDIDNHSIAWKLTEMQTKSTYFMTFRLKIVSFNMLS